MRDSKGFEVVRRVYQDQELSRADKERRDRHLKLIKGGRSRQKTKFEFKFEIRFRLSSSAFISRDSNARPGTRLGAAPHVKLCASNRIQLNIITIQVTEDRASLKDV